MIENGRSVWVKIQAIVTLLVFLGSLASLYASYRVTTVAHDAAIDAISRDLGEIKGDLKEVRRDVTALQVHVAAIAAEKEAAKR